jgi:hypothetical protein
MSQHSLSIANQLAASFRADISAALQALASQSAGTNAPATTYAYQVWCDTTNGVIKQRNAANSAWIVRAPLAETLVVGRSANTALGIGDMARVIIATGTWTQTLNPCATLGDGWVLEYRNDGTGVITIDPNAAETIDGVSTMQLAPGESCCIYCDGTQLKTIGRTSLSAQNQTATAFTTAGAAPAFTLTPVPALNAYAANQRFRVKVHAAGTIGSNTLNVSGLGIKNLMQYDSTGVKVSAVVASGQLFDVEYDGADFVILDQLPPAAGVNSRSVSASASLVLTDNGLSIDFTGGAGQTIAIPANASVAFPVGATVTFTNTTANSLSIAITTDTLRQAGSTNTGTRTLANYGVATARKVSSTVWIISGAGLS